MHVKELNDELMMTYRSRDVKTDLLDNARTWLQHAPDELTVTQNYVHHLEGEMHEWDEQLKASQAQAAELQNAVEHLQELLPQDEEPERAEEDTEEVEGSSGVEITT
jgi:chromosome segregation ATPase